jgi:hypothetical protein
VPVTVTNLSNGVYISQITSATNGPGVPDASGVIQLGNLPGNVMISGLVAGATGTLNTTFTVTCMSYCGAGNGTVTIMNASSTTPTAIWAPPGGGGTFMILMNTTAGGSSFGSATAVVGYQILL